MNKISERMFIGITLLLYAATAVFLSLNHVVWRDEVTPLSMVSGSASPLDLLSNIKNYGHPSLWFLILYFAYQIFHSFLILKPLNLLICILSAYLFLSRAPFSRFQKALFLMGFFPLYLYPVFNRNYGLSMLLCFVVATLYPRRFKKILWVGAALFLLANTHAHSLIFVIAVTLALATEFFFSSKTVKESGVSPYKIVAGFTLMIAGIACCILQIFPDRTSIIFNSPLSTQKVLWALAQSLAMPGKAFPAVLGVPSSLFVTFVIFWTCAYLSRKPYLLFIFTATVVGLNLFFYLFYHSFSSRHQGAFYLLLITVLWLAAYTDEQGPAFGIFKKIKDFTGRHKELWFTLLLMLQVYAVYPALKNELTRPHSSSKALGQFLLKTPEFKEAILTGEPDFYLESLPYYADNAIYLLREKAFGKYIHFSLSNRKEYSLEELLDDAKNLKESTGKKVLIAMGHPLSSEGPFTINFSYNKIFVYSKKSLEDFLGQTKLVKGFHGAISNENYDIYEVL